MELVCSLTLSKHIR